MRGSGHERQTLALVGKCTLAATVAWFVAYDLMSTPAAAFAPFSAVLIMQVTVYPSLVQSLRYVGAVCAGVALQAAFGLAFGPGVVAFALVALVALAIGQWRSLGAQRTQVATAAFFAFSLYVTADGTAGRLTHLAQIIVVVLIGCGIGVTINVVILPPMRYRSAEYGVRVLAGALRDLIDDIIPVLRDGDLSAEHTGKWRRRASRLRPISDQAQASLNSARESLYLNPRRLLYDRTRRASFSGYEELIEALRRVTYQVGSLTRSLDHGSSDEAGPAGRDFLARYADLLSRLSHLTRVLADLDEDRLAEQTEELSAAAGCAERARVRLTEEAGNDGLPLGDPTRPYGVLVVEATRLTEEFRHTAGVLNAQVKPG